MSLQEKAQAVAQEFQKLQADMAKAVEAREKLGTQQSENELVKNEFAKLTPSNAVYKLIGPVLVKQDQAEAKTNVNTRLDFIKGEIKRAEAQIQDIETKSEQKKKEVCVVLIRHRQRPLHDLQFAAAQTALQQQQNPGAVTA
ncbi:prefoldin subunit 6 [Armillaria luteobubalina]|uniref:Prefoldin subunit 6 n=1 Tax=Armillaria luteobubalina TaxID=153913 RepID=A0AA39UWF9_9AGAR|nr:prefoldin subunit 6 [Armillaria luteobubalina]